MRHFFIQKSELMPDFCYEALRAVEYQNWLCPGSVEARTGDATEGKPGGVPIGSVEFVVDFAKAMGVLAAHPKPLNIPAALTAREFSARSIWKRIDSATIPPALPAFVFAKSAARYKGFTGVVQRADVKDVLAKHGPLDLSEEVEFGDEWRAFVHGGRLVDLHCYSGLFSRVPSREFIGRAIAALGAAIPSLKSYTLDVGFIGSVEAVVEVHPFVSCGLYGFRDYRILLSMFEHGFRWFCNG